MSAIYDLLRDAETRLLSDIEVASNAMKYHQGEADKSRLAWQRAILELAEIREELDERS